MKVSGLAGHGVLWRRPTTQVTFSPLAQESREGVGCFGNLPTTCETLSQEAAAPHAGSVHHVPNSHVSRDGQPSFQLSGTCWKSIQTGFKSNTKISSKYKSTLRERTNMIQCEREKIQIRCRETRHDSSLNSLLIEVASGGCHLCRRKLNFSNRLSRPSLKKSFSKSLPAHK